ncbi:MAG TPA: S41 family peptidase [Puia sp.]|nr:S41 family peptidase [Puia sp.]
MQRYLVLPLLLAASLFAHAQSAITDTLPCMQKAQKLLTEALSFMEKNYYRRDEVNWPEFEARAKQQLMTAGNCEDAYASISWCFKQLNERHSFIMSPARAAKYTGDEDDPALSPEPPLSELVGDIHSEWLQDSIAYLSVPWVTTDDSLICERIADSLQRVIARLDARGGISRWIIDLRKNTGGNIWPMLTGIGPLLGDGVCGYFVSGDDRVPISYRDGSAIQGRHVRCRVSNQGYRTLRAQKSIVVLTGRRTVSAGEFVALAFKGRSQTLLIGEPTAGLTTGNATYSLSDKSLLVLTICQEADCSGHVCDGSIVPDKLIPAAPTAGDDPAKEAAVNWLTSR